MQGHPGKRDEKDSQSTSMARVDGSFQRGKPSFPGSVPYMSEAKKEQQGGIEPTALSSTEQGSNPRVIAGKQSTGHFTSPQLHKEKPHGIATPLHRHITIDITLTHSLTRILEKDIMVGS